MSEELAEYGAAERAGRAEGSDAGMPPAEARRRGGPYGDGMPCCVRHASGLYLEAKVWRPGRVMLPGYPRDIMLRWRMGMAAGTAMPRGMAARTAAVYIALTGDHGLEIEEAEA